MKEKAVLEMKLQAVETKNPQASKPKGRLRIRVKPWRDAREAYYPVIEYAIAQDCTVEGVDLPDEHLAHLSPLGWAHIQLTGEYRWKERRRRNP